MSDINPLHVHLCEEIPVFTDESGAMEDNVTEFGVSHLTGR